MTRPDPEHVAFGQELVRSREAKELTRDAVAKTTKIPERTLACLEEGRFAELPADVFVKGFLKSYARCLGLDPTETITRWESSRTPATSAPASASPSAPASASPSAPASASPSVSAPVRPAPAAATASAPVLSTPVTPVPPPSTPPADLPRPHALDHIHAITRGLANLGHGARRMPLTLAVIILVIVATLTVSLLLRRPDTRPRGGGISSLDQRIGPRAVSPRAPAAPPAAPSRA